MRIFATWFGSCPVTIGRIAGKVSFVIAGSPRREAAELLRPELGLRLDAFPALLLADPAVLGIAAFDGAFRRFVPLRQPVAERVAEPRRLRAQLRQPQFLP